MLADSGADLLIYGMGENPLREILKLLNRGVPISSLTTIAQTAVLLSEGQDAPKNKNWQTIELSSHQNCLKDKKIFASNFKHIEKESNRIQANRLIQKVGKQLLVINPPYPTMSEKEIDAPFDLPYTRTPHPKYKNRGMIPAYEMIRHSINLHRGCFGGCSFCTISAHQGKFIASRSKKSIMKEVEAVTQMPDFKGYISDLGGPSANMYKMKGIEQGICDLCVRPSCIYPSVCFNLDTNHQPMTDIYKSVAGHPKVKKAFVSSGIRYDLLLAKNKKESQKRGLEDYLEQVVTQHVSGRLKVAPEHNSDRTLKIMRKPSFKLFYQFKKMFDTINEKNGLSQFLVPYFISSHPGSELENMAELAAESKALGFKLEQVQDFTPTPMTVATVIYYSGYHPYTMEKIYTARTRKEKQNQNRFFFWYKKENRGWIYQKLIDMLRDDLVKKLLH